MYLIIIISQQPLQVYNYWLIIITPASTPNSNNGCFHQGHVQFKIHGTVWHTPVFCFTPSLLQLYKFEAIKETPRRIQESTLSGGP